MVLWKPFRIQFEPKAILGANEAGFEVVDVLDELSPSKGDSDSVRAETGSEPISEQDEFETGPEPVPEFGEFGVEPPLLFEDVVDDSFDGVTNFKKEEVVEISILAVQPSKESQPSERQKKKRIKTPAGRTDLPLVCQFKVVQAKASSSPSQPRSTKPKPSVKPTRKSFRIATQSTRKPHKKSGSSKQSPPVIEEKFSL